VKYSRKISEYLRDEIPLNPPLLKGDLQQEFLMMKKAGRAIITIMIFLSVAGMIFTTFSIAGCSKEAPQKALTEEHKKIQYQCPMHPEIIQDKPGKCPICGMDLVPIKEQAAMPGGNANGSEQVAVTPSQRKILFYRNPMNPQITSKTPAKDEMGMDYIPVYATVGGEDKNKEAGVYISTEKQQLIGVTKEKIEKRHLTYQINTVGEIAYDPELYVAQEEYLQALKMVKATERSVLASVKEQSRSLLDAAGKKLLLLGMSKEQIEEWAKGGKAEENLFLPGESGKVWAYLNVYEYEINLITRGTPVEIAAVAFPGEFFPAQVSSITPVLNAETRSLRIRAEINDTGHKLRPQMFINAKINVDLGEKLAVPESAVIDTGVRKIVYIINQDETFSPREVSLGHNALGYFEVNSGLSVGDTVATSGNFLIDSESKLEGFTQQSPEHKHGE